MKEYLAVFASESGENSVDLLSDTDDKQAASGPSLDTLFTALADQQRRYLLRYLVQTGREVTGEEVAEAVVTQERKRKRNRGSFDWHERVETRLQRNHLPLLRDGEIVNYDEKSGSVSLRVSAEKIATCLNRVVELKKNLRVKKA